MPRFFCEKKKKKERTISIFLPLPLNMSSSSYQSTPPHPQPIDTPAHENPQSARTSKPRPPLARS
ncbi:hypothetical protein L873DRAFT_1802383 [Choiromyces venosus 120613-1]|uniref:Uncharacterized protein n=1 Tax=Choiromyces venosus 120613-1 TaxID=1336337 RepID=A0A3N4JYU0_9PEZI|nr:hypothetical protein L873DRAFT_1802383 [Choiromyces venosus 120613-1]